jgi:hypothetical protein
VSRITHFGDSGTGTHRGEHLDFASSEVPRKSESIRLREDACREILSRDSNIGGQQEGSP